MPTESLLKLPSGELRRLARAKRDATFGTVVTYSPKVFIPLTMLCRDRCGYCTFAKPPPRLDSPYLTQSDVLKIARSGAAAGCHEALFTLGEKPELRYPAARQWLDDNGYSSTVEYLAAMMRLVIDETGLLPHANAGALNSTELCSLRQHAPSQGMMLETLAELDCHHGSPDKTARRRLGTLEAAGRLHIPFTTGILVGIGETPNDRLEAIQAIAQSHRQHGHVQEVIVQNFVPKTDTAMRHRSPIGWDDFLDTIAMARAVLPAEISVQAPPNLSEDLAGLLAAGINDWGGVSPVTLDHVNPERPWPQVERLRLETEAAGFELAARLTVYPRYVQHAAQWLDPKVRAATLNRSDASGLARDRDDGWFSGTPTSPPQLLPRQQPRSAVSGALREVIDGVRSGHVVEIDELVTLFAARGLEIHAVAELADDLRSQTVGDVVTYVSNRNINYTNVCTYKCRFCGFSKGPMSLNLRGDPYLLTLDDIAERARSAYFEGATEVCLQGGIHPSFDGNYYIDVTRAVKQAAPDIHVHGFTALEVTEGARRLSEPLPKYLQRLMDAGLRSLPGTAAEILDDEVRAVLCPDKIDSEEWLDAHRAAHSVGLRSNVTIMFGSIERPLHWARHILRTRKLQSETGGFTEFVPLPFVHMAAPIYLQGKSRRGPTFREVVLMHAVGRIAYHGFIDNVQASWVKVGFDGLSQLLLAGANDLGGTLIDESISRAAGAEHGQSASSDDFASIVGPLGRRLVQRTTLYAPISPAQRAALTVAPPASPTGAPRKRIAVSAE